MKQKVIAIVGPTAVGKTKMGVYLAKRLDGEVINGDASQIYREMSIGTAKATAEEMDGVPHHLLDICDPSETYTAADYQRDARQTIERLGSHKKQPILVGGTGFYIKAALYSYRFSDIKADKAYRQQLEQYVQVNGAEALHAKLAQVDPMAASKIHPHNAIRVIRALEVYQLTGIPFSKQQQQVSDQPIYPVVFIGLTMPREILYQRIDRRVDKMMEAGLLKEVQQLYDQGLAGSQALQAIGYKEFFPYFEGKQSLEASIDQLKKNSRHYAKRQFTWFRGQMQVKWFDMTHAEDCFSQHAEDVLSYIIQQQKNV
ncbi:tRNA (adenosine(37)-N6)-dimethylallyltransferase MiaA [Sporolactobacillus spathodeae]|uniref:tRNA dimethylallyltransferase n=1 Tax=Sporolactobacillus spathodeae TaxID=1465502 RepID=A0ABS2Q7Z3_9BACL|nr:tRNA (adenosine(37)-N6)-dimethylallyltransferase MiaA [Sporolactobacillus spathodeae]MBM7657087.1 tRNA dimethylallyltransferase [Sporolactobacillus spathodeae]